MGEAEKQKLGVVRVCARELFRRFLRPRFLRRRGGRTRWRPSAKSSPISRKNAQGLSRLLLLFSVGATSCERAQGWLSDCAALFLRGARRAFHSLPERLRASGGARFAAEQWEAEVSVFAVWSRNGLEIHCDVRKKYRRFFGEME